MLVTGGTGSFGRRFIATLLREHAPARVVVYSRDELKQFDMQQSEPYQSAGATMRYFLGDVRDADRLRRACEDIDVIVHAAALKQVPAAEYNPFEAVKTNVIGAENVINAALAHGVSRVVALSTDKAAAPVNLYGATKLVSDKLFVAANNHRGKRDIKFCAVRYGNVFGSRGSVVPFFLEQRNRGVLPITDARMTRFSITLDQGVAMVNRAIEQMWGGEVFVPKIPSYRILDLAAAVAPGVPHEIVGIRAGEKLHEQMVTDTDALNTVEFDDYFVILPSIPTWDTAHFVQASAGRPGRRCDYGFSYDSGTNPHFLTVAELSGLLDRL